MNRFACISALALLCPTSIAAQTYSPSGAGSGQKGDYGSLVEKAATGDVRLEQAEPSSAEEAAPKAHRSLSRIMADLDDDDDAPRGRGLYLHRASEFAGEPHRVSVVNRAGWDRDFLPADVPAPYGLPAGDVLIDTGARQLYVGLGQGAARRYGIAVGREGAAWKGTATVSRKARWPDWHPTPDMRRKDRRLKRLVEGGERNPLGARAIYLDIGGADSLYRIHGTTAPSSIGHAASHGCIRMLNEDVIELYPMVRTGATVYVR